MNREYSLEQEELRKVRAEYMFAKKLGLIDNADFAVLEQRRLAKNEENQERKRKGEPVYGLISYSVPVYLQYEVTRFKLDFTQEIDQIKKNYQYHNISEEEKRQFYSENMDLFTRFFGDTFSYEEVEMIIEKRIREGEYEKNVKDILCQLP